jgi:hypothetical protein
MVKIVYDVLTDNKLIYRSELHEQALIGIIRENRKLKDLHEVEEIMLKEEKHGRKISP